MLARSELMDSRGGRGTAFCCGLPHTTWAGGRSSGAAAAVKDTGQHARRQLKAMSVLTMMFAGVALLLLSLSIVSARAPQCCSDLTRHSPCRYACEQLSVTGSQNGQLQQLVNAGEHCTQEVDLQAFWDCVNTSLSVLSDLEAWPGRLCCDRVVSTYCKDACQQATSLEQLDNKCRRSDELGFYSCYKRQKAAEQCCSQANTLNCKTACHNVYLNDRMSSRDQQEVVRNRCGEASPLVVRCVQNQTRSSPATDPQKSLPCCDRAESKKCQSKCRSILVTLATEQEIMDELIQSCGSPSPIDPMWQCFLSRSERGGPPVNTTKIVIDGVKLQCCSKASDSKCRNLCVQTYSRGWAVTWNDFNHLCLDHKPTSPLKICLDEVEEPCQFGCSGLDFCSNFNNRPSELFRSCNAQADQAAEAYVKAWQSKRIILPQMIIPVKDIRYCEPEKWKAIACSLQLKPCRGRPGRIAFCWDDCMEILTQCIDPKRLHSQQTVKTLCMNLAPRNLHDECVSIKQYLAPSPVDSRESEVTNPCRSNPCLEGQVCQINRRKCRHADRCPSYVCKPGCNMGEVSNFRVPQNSYVRIPRANGKLNCHEVYYCTHRGELEFKTKMTCDVVKNCGISDSSIAAHSSHMTIDCNECVCQGGEVFCTKRHCPAKQVESTAYTGLPCNCNPAQYQPVCSVSGKTYPSACLAKCAGIGENRFHPGSCAESDPCAVNPCSAGFSCVRRPQVCLSLRTVPCKQYQCVAETLMCNHHHHDEVCDNDGVEYTNMCLLRLHQRKLHHWGHCLQNCDMTVKVCGHDGETYSSECTAMASWTTVDYYGPCQAVGKVSADNSDSYRCDKVQCRPLKPASCNGIIPPGGCCPVCATELQLLFSEEMVEKVSRTIHRPLTIQNITSKLSEFLTISECGVFGYISIEGTIITLFMPVTAEPTALQLEACNHEAQRIQRFLQMSSPNVMTHLALTPILMPKNTLRTSNITLVTESNSGQTTLSWTLTLMSSVLLSLMLFYLQCDGVSVR
ncbi:reversion-inducing cysteine-rich protein with Kazal motifs-like [Liolophura sinensis]|uniref:reversion-inducing cysteine-rich protein with Kazal motifs-like n=1 Tax=Liolophura sinensis TaxID=3198878 RepID=UPI0031580CAE